VLVEGLLEGRRVRERREQWEVIRESTLKWMAASAWGLVSASARLLSDGREVARFTSLNRLPPDTPTAAGAAALNELGAAVDRRLKESGRPSQAPSFDPPAFLHWSRFTERRRALMNLVFPG
jgi:hypothetical protein